jgi:hypothetical protein
MTKKNCEELTLYTNWSYNTAKAIVNQLRKYMVKKAKYDPILNKKVQ